MDLTKVFSILLLFNYSLQVHGFLDPVSLALVGAGASAIMFMLKKADTSTKEAAVNFVKRAAEKTCQMVGYCEGCEDYWIPANLKGLEYELRSQVFGQPLAVDIILSTLKHHLKNKRPEKSLVLSFQGSPGTGKNFISQKILKNMFKLGDQTKYVNFFRGSNDFPSKDKVDKYRSFLRDTIQEKVYQCQRSIFVFDEVEKMPNGILDVISGFVQARRQGDYDYRKVIFILLSNVGFTSLNSEALNAWLSGTPREEMDVKKLNHMLATESFNSEGGLYMTSLVRNGDISFFVPFLPLERHHIVQCLEHHVSNVMGQVMSPELTELVLEDMTFGPEPYNVFSSTGCKRVAEVAAYNIERELRRRRKSIS